MMAAVTTFLVGAVVGGGVKWAYDKWQGQEERPMVASVREKSASTVRNLGQSVRNVARRKQNKGGTQPEAAEGSETAVETVSAST
jgi:hypothetical protein